MNANHRQICKFEKPTETNYITVRNALVSTIQPILKTWFRSRFEGSRRDIKMLGTFLGVFERPEDDLKPEEDRAEGTCEWLVDKSSFNQWVDEDYNNPKLFWLNGNPASGKSVLASYVIRYLESANRECSYFFFRHNDESRCSTTSMLRSIAYQMALTNVRIREALLNIRDEGEINMDQSDGRTIWRKIFTSLIFKMNFHQPHFWIIDGLDECRNCADIVSMLARIDGKIPLRVFISSLGTSYLDKLFRSFPHPTTIESMSFDQIQADIQLYIDVNIDTLPVTDDLARKQLTKRILNKSKDCFLWAHLVLRELEQTYSEKQIMEVLDEVPKQMGPLYTRLLGGMSKNIRNRELIRAILIWTVCATRPLELLELKEALSLDIAMNVLSLDKLIESNCGNMVYVDKQSKVQLIHPTARAFLLDQPAGSEFAINLGAGHARLAVACLKYLTGDEMVTPRHRRKSNAAHAQSMSCFVDYASTAFSEHVKHSSRSIDLPLTLVDKFFEANVLTWIERLATRNHLSHVLQTARDLKTYLQRRADQRSPLGKEFQNTESWANDLIRIVLAFGDQLVDFPFAIHFLIPSICPSQSQVFSQFAGDAGSLEVVGASAKEWHDHLSCITHRDHPCSALACHDNRLAIGLSSGAIILYSASTFRRIQQLEHRERVQHLELARTDTLLASGGRRRISMWNTVTGDQLWTVDTDSALLTLWFFENETILAAATKSNWISSWSVSNGTWQATHPWHDRTRAQNVNLPPGTHQRAPTLGEFSVELNVLAIAYRSKPLVLWDLEENSLIGTFDRRASPHWEAVGTRPPAGSSVPSAAAIAMAFNPDPNLRLLAVAYQDGDLAVIDPMNQDLKTPIVIAEASTLAASPDGKTLATGDAAGTIKLFNFETLELFYQMYCTGYDIKALAFSADGLRFFDIRGPHCNVWGPSVLVRKTTDDSTDDSNSDTLVGPVETVERSGWIEDKSITAIEAHHTGEYIFCARADGSVCAWRTETGSIVQELYRHAEHIAVCSLVWNAKESLLASGDLSGRFMVRRVLIRPSEKWKIDEPIIDSRSDHSIHQIVLHPNGDRTLLSTSECDTLWDSTGKKVAVHKSANREPWIWMTHPSNSDHLLLLSGIKAQVFHWSSLEELDPTQHISLRTEHSPDFILNSARSIDWSNLFLLEHLKSSRTSTIRYITLWNADEMQSETSKLQCHASFSRIASEMRSVVSVYGSSLIFLSHLRWFCTLDLDSSNDDSYVRHFFVPPEWYSFGHQLMCCVTVKGDVVIVQDDDIIVVKKGLSLRNTVHLE